MRIVGASTTAAPSPRSRAASPLACARARVTATLTPASGPAREPGELVGSAATSPTTVIAGARASCSPSAASVRAQRRADRRASRARRWRPARRGRARARRAARRCAAAGARPCRRRACRGTRRAPPSRSVSACRIFVPGDERDGARQPALRHRDARVGGRRDAGGDAGHDLERHPAARSACASSPPRPKTNGSPPFSRTTVRPDRACSTSRRVVSSCGTCSPPPTLPTSMISASRRAPASASAGIRRSWRMTSAAAMSSIARAVSRPGSPGPAPTRYRPAHAEHLARAGAQQPRGHARTELLGVVAVAARRAPTRSRRARRRTPGSVRPPSLSARERADRRVAVGLERAYERALGKQRTRRAAGGRSTRRNVLRTPPASPLPGALPGGRAPAPSSAQSPSLRAAQSLQSGEGEHDRVVVAGGQLAQPRVDVAAQLERSRGRPAAPAAARCAAARPSRRGRRAATRRATRRPQSASRGSARAGTAAMTTPSAAMPGRPWPSAPRRSIVAVEQRARRARAPSAPCRARLTAVAGRRDLDDLVLAAERGGHLAGLRQRERAAARADPHARRFSGRTSASAGLVLDRRVVEPEQLAQELQAAVAAASVPSGGSSARAAAAA